VTLSLKEHDGMNEKVIARKWWTLEVAEYIGLLIILTYTAVF
jgi:hypothetical protein